MRFGWLHLDGLSFVEAEWLWLVILLVLVLLLAAAFGGFLALVRSRDKAAREDRSSDLRRLWDDTEYGVAPTVRERAWFDLFDAELAGRSR